MDTQSFFQAVIPSDGYKYLVEIAANGSKHHTAYVDFESMADAAEKFIAAEKSFYHACASFKELEYNEWGYVIGRKQENVKWVKSLWQDFDVGKLEKDGVTLKPFCYATRKDAYAAIKHLMQEVGLPRPLLVNSGTGLHAYWPFTEAVAPAEWHSLTAMVRTAYQALGIKFDPSRDMDSASILRPVGSFNKGVEVTVVRETEPKPFAFYYELFSRYLAAHDLAAQPTRTRSEKLENEFAGNTEFPPSSLLRIAVHCEQIKEFQETGCGTEPLWHACLGIAKHCEDGDERAHQWSEQYDGYTFEETQHYLDKWKYGPTSCEKFQQLNAEKCEGCPRAGKITSPIVLGYAEETLPPSIQVTVNPGNTEIQDIPHWPKGFMVTPSGIIQMIVKDEDGVPSPMRVGAPLFYLTERIRLDDGTYAFTVRMEVKKSYWREFQLPAKSMSDARSLKSVLSSYEIITYSDKLMSTYIQSYADALRRNVEEINTFKQFGWTKDRDGFLIGKTLMTAEGRKEVRVSDAYIRDELLHEAAATKGTQAEWRDGVNKLYNQVGGEPWQYTICTQFGAPLMALLDYDEWNGIPLGLTSGDSGYGKSTVCKIGINALSNSRKTTISDTTVNAIVGRASVMNNLPLLIDEITRSLPDPKDLSDVLYSLSNGRPRIGMQSDGRERIPLPPFKLGSTVTGNKNLMAQLAESKLNPEATQMRVFEIAMEDYERMDSLKKDSASHAEHHELALYLVDNVYGVYTDDYFKFVFANYDDVRARLHKAAMTIVRSLGGDAAKERFYAYHMACTLVGGWIARKIGALSFDLTNLKRWAFEHITHMRTVAQQYGESVEDKFSSLLSALHGSVLVTKHFDLLDSKTGNTEMPMLPIKSEVRARLVLGSEKERGKLYVAVKAVDEWCIANQVSSIQFRRNLAQANLLRGGGENGRGFDKKVSISRGVPSHPMGRCRCLELDFAVAQGYVDEHLLSTNVVPIKPGPAPSAPTAAPVSAALQEL